MPDLEWTTERPNKTSADIDTMPVEQMVSIILAADAGVAGAVQQVSAQVSAAAELMVTAIAAGGRVHYVGAGTSGRMGVLDAAELLPTFGVGDDVVLAHLAGGPTASVKAVEGAEDDTEAGAHLVEAAGPHDVIVGIAASGRTPYVEGALHAARQRRIATVLIAGNQHAPIAVDADVAVLFDTGPEVLTGSTRMKAATAQKMILNAMSTATMIKLGHTYSNLMIDMLPTNEKLRARSVKMLAQGSGRPAEQCAGVLAEAGGDVRVALIALLADATVQDAAQAEAHYPRLATRAGDPSGIRSAVASLTTTVSV